MIREKRKERCRKARNREEFERGGSKRVGKKGGECNLQSITDIFLRCFWKQTSDKTENTIASYPYFVVCILLVFFFIFLFLLHCLDSFYSSSSNASGDYLPIFVEIIVVFILFNYFPIYVLFRLFLSRHNCCLANFSMTLFSHEDENGIWCRVQCRDSHI